MDSIEKEISYYKTHRLVFVKQYGGKYLAIKGMSVIGVYNTYSEAREQTGKLHDKDTYIIEHPLDLSARRTYIKRR